MGGTDDERQPVACDCLLNEVISVDAAFHEAEVGGAVLNGPCHFGRVAGDEIDRDARVRSAKADQPRRQPIARDGLARINREGAALEAGDLRQGEPPPGCAPGRRVPRLETSGPRA